MAKVEDRPVDAGVAQLRGKDDASAVEWWKGRFALLAGVPTEVARAGALIPQIRELSRLPDAERRRLTKARLQAAVAIPADQRQKVMSALSLASALDPALVKGDQDLAQQLAAEVPGASDMLMRQG
ncbi:MAG: hypothetical protein HYX56_02125 [Chloroflexi bacterium]|nr:hypothetical protein [Chloroflexota bacterium]